MPRRGEIEDGLGWGGLLPSRAERDQEREEAHRRKQVEVLRAERDHARAALLALLPVAEVKIEPDYWSGGHFHQGHRKCLVVTGDLADLPIGTKLYVDPTAPAGR